MFTATNVIVIKPTRDRREYFKEWRHKNKEKFKLCRQRYCEIHPDRIKETKRRYYIGNQDKIKAYRIKRYLRDGDKIRGYSKNYYYKHREDSIAKTKQRNREIKREVLGHYSPELKCASCGYTNIRALTLDHINNDGAKQRRELKKLGVSSGSGFYRWVKKNGYPSDLQVLCMNCQFIKRDE